MKHLKSLLIIAFLSFGISTANAQKVAHVNLERVVANMPETRALQAEIEKITKTYRDDIGELAKKLDSKIKKYEAEQQTQTQEANVKRAQEVQAERQRISQAEQAAYQDIQERRQKGLIPILQKVENSLKEVAKSRGIQYVLDASAGKGLLIKDGDDLYNAMKVKLGLLEDQKPPQNPNAK